jgi:pSer/pThr/pTyr-binding forkhead associated (FHA) protein
MVLGRDTSCDISLDSSYVSRYQNLFMETSEGWMLIDLNSTNGCFVNGRKVSEHHLRDGDLISVGQHQLRFTGPNGALAEALEGTQRARPAEPGQGAPAAGAAVTELRRDSVVRRG